MSRLLSILITVLLIASPAAAGGGPHHSGFGTEKDVADLMDRAEALYRDGKLIKAMRLLEQTERLNNRARAAAAKAKFEADEEISLMDHDLEMKKAALKKTLLEQEAGLTKQSLEEELKRNRMRLAFEKEELDVLKSSPELLMLTPQAARLAEASQNLKNARTIVSFTPQELVQGSELLSIFQNMLQKSLDEKKNSSQ